MAFIDAILPNPKLIHGLETSIEYPVEVVGNGTTEFRIARAANYRYSWRWPSRLVKAVDRKTLALFCTDTAKFSLNSFKFKHPDLYAWNSTPLIYTGSGNNFYLTTGIDTHPIFHLGGDVVVKSGSTPVSFTKVITNGVPMVNVPAYTSGLTISGSFFFAARFDQTQMTWVHSALNSDNSSFGDTMGDVTLKEVFEY